MKIRGFLSSFVAGAAFIVVFFGSFAVTLALSLPLDVPADFAFTRALAVGSRGDDVTNLQKILKNDGVYPAGLITGYFGNLTKRAVTFFQLKYSIDPVGAVGPKTRAKLNQLLAAVRGANSAAQTGPVNASPRRQISADDLVGASAPPTEKQAVQQSIDIANLIGQMESLPATTASLKKLQQLEQQMNTLLQTVPVSPTSSTPLPPPTP